MLVASFQDFSGAKFALLILARLSLHYRYNLFLGRLSRNRNPGQAETQRIEYLKASEIATTDTELA